MDEATADDRLTPDEIAALAEAFPVGPPSLTLLRTAGFPSAVIPAMANLTALDFWTQVAELVAAGVMLDGRRRLLRAARRRYPFNKKFSLAQGGAGPLRVLVIGASPDDPDLPHVRADRESHAIGKAALPGRVEVKAVLGAEATDVREVGSFRPDILHFVCHGYDEGLIFNDTRGEADFVKASRIAELLRHYRDSTGVRLRGIVLAACDGGTLAPHFTGVTNTVIAHRGKLSDPCGVTFAEQLYRRLNETGDLAAAAREAAQLTAQFSAPCTPVITNLIVRGADDRA